MKQQLQLTKRQDKGSFPKRVRRQCKKLIQGAGRLLLSCAVVLFLLYLMFLLAKGPAYISFSGRETEKSALSGLYSRCIQMQADSVAADIIGCTDPDTKITGKGAELSSDALCRWLRDYLEESGTANAKDPRLLIEGERVFAMELTYKAADATARYMIENADTVNIDPTRSAPLSCSFGQVRIYPRVSQGEAYESFVALQETVTVNIPAEPGICCYVVFEDSKGAAGRVPLDFAILPGCQAASEGQLWKLALQDTSLQVVSAEKTQLQLECGGRYGLKLASAGGTRIRGYLTGELLFQNTNTPKNYALAGQLVDIESRNSALHVILRTDTRYTPQMEEELFISGEATRMDISGVDPFPDMRMWFRENVYIAPVSLLSIMISMYGLPPRKGSKKVKPRRIR